MALPRTVRMDDGVLLVVVTWLQARETEDAREIDAAASAVARCGL